MKLFKWTKLTKAKGRSYHLISIFSPFSSLPFAFSTRRGILWSWAISSSFWSLQPRTMGLCIPWPAVGKRATLESSDWKSENIGLPVELRMPTTSNTFVGTLSLSAPNVDNNDLLHDQNWFTQHWGEGEPQIQAGELWHWEKCSNTMWTGV